MNIDSDAVGWIAGLWLTQALLATGLTWMISRPRVQSPGLVTAWNLLLALFPPFNLLVLALLSTMDRRYRP